MEQMEQTFEDGELVLARFNRLIQEILRGTMNRNCFRPWEIHLLLDIESCSLREGAKRETIRRYQKAVRRAMEKGASKPMLLSEYLDGGKARKEGTAADADVQHSPATTT